MCVCVCLEMHAPCVPVVITATAIALQRTCIAICALVRRFMLSFAVHGYACGRTGHHIQIVRIRRRRSHAAEQRRWQEAMTRELASAPNPKDQSTTTLTLQHVRNMFQREMQIVRFVCATHPGPRFPWPGFLSIGTTTSGQRRKREPSDNDPSVLLEHVTNHLETLQRSTV